MGDERPRDAEHPGIARERPDRELGKLAVISRRQVRMDRMDLLFDEMIIVDQPFRCGRYRATVVDRLDGGAIGLEENRSIFAEPPRKELPLGRLGRYDLRNRETARMILEALNTEEFFANGIFAIPRRRYAHGLKGAPQENFQFGLSAAGCPARNAGAAPAAVSA